MTIPRWLLPVVAIVAAIAVGVAAALIGMRFAPPAPASAFVAPDTEVAQVIAPVPQEDGDDGEDADGDGDPADPPPGAAPGDSPEPPAESPVVGEREVAVPVEDPAASDSELLRLVDLIGLSPDLLVGLMDLGGGERDDDPCAPREGDSADDCPPGVEGAVLYDLTLPPLWMNAQVFPRTHDELGDLPAGDFAELFCDIAQEDEDEATLRIRATAPGTWTVRYWPVDHPDLVQDAGPVTSSDAQIADWQVQAETDGGVYIAEHCLRLPGLEPGTVYTAVVSGSDTFGRTPAAQTLTFNSDGVPRHPELELQPVGQNLLLASVPHRPDETVSMRAYLVPYDAVTDCSAAEETIYDIPPLTTVDHVAVSRSERLRLNITDDNTEKSVLSYRVPEGATLLMCARWFPGGDAPTWESDNATFEASAIVQSADRFLPSLEFSGFIPRDDRTVDLQMSVATAEGTVCSRLSWNSASTDFPRSLCHPDNVATGGAESSGTDGSERLADRGFSGDLVIRVDATLSSGETSETTYVLPAGFGSCVGVCSAPGPSEYAVATIGGTMHLTERWVAGLQNGGVSEWRIWGQTSNPVDYVAPDAPQLDRAEFWTYSEPGFSPNVTASLEVRVDRPVDWEFTTYTGSSDSAMSCGPSPSPVEDSGRADDGVVRISVQACLGGTYLGILRLTDDDGNVSLYSAPGAGPSAGWWPAGVIAVPRLDVTIRYRVDVFSHSQVYVQQLGLVINGSELRLRDDYASPPGSRCSLTGQIKSEGRFDQSLDASFTAGLAVLIVDQRAAGGSCAGDIRDERAIPALTTVQIAQAGTPDGVLIEAPGSSLRIWVTRR